MASFVDELNTICRGNCKECETKLCVDREIHDIKRIGLLLDALKCKEELAKEE